jgi:Uma2 family endonuclease
MSLPEQYFYISVEDYLAGEKVSPVRHEYIDGVVYAMAGGTKRHSRVAKNLFTRLEAHLDGGDCEAFIFDMKTCVSPILYYYPDLVVTCEDLPEKATEIHEPRLIIEVLSASTAVTDRREKLLEYRRIPSLQEYVIVWQDEMRVEIYRRQAGDAWDMVCLTKPEEELSLVSVNLSLPLRDVYRRVTFS